MIRSSHTLPNRTPHNAHVNNERKQQHAGSHHISSLSKPR